MGFGATFGIFGILGVAFGWWSHDKDFLVFGLGCLVIVAIVLLIGVIGDYLHNKKVDRGQAPYRLPFWIRWDDWKLGPPPNDWDRWMTKRFIDKRFGKEVVAHQFRMPM